MVNYHIFYYIIINILNHHRKIFIGKFLNPIFQRFYTLNFYIIKMCFRVVKRKTIEAKAKIWIYLKKS